MSKHRHKSNEGNKVSRNQFGRNMNNNPFGISPQQLLGLLGGNIDMNGLGNMLSNMGKEGFDLNSLNQGLNGVHNGFDGNNITSDLNQGNKKHKDSEEDNIRKEKHKKNDIQESYNNEEDENIQLLKSLRFIVDPNRVEFIDKIIDLYNDGIFDDK